MLTRMFQTRFKRYKNVLYDDERMQKRKRFKHCQKYETDEVSDNSKISRYPLTSSAYCQSIPAT